ncbi:MAG: TonB-dependent receptor [Bacteroidales bacterium]|nr:TonB-dependent receptor [Bacteroidales bacterium]
MELRQKMLYALVLLLCPLTLQAAVLKGKVVDAQTGEALIGATVQILQAGKTATTDNDGLFVVQGLGQRNYTLVAHYISYEKKTMTVNPAKTDTLLIVPMSLLETELGTATVSAKAKRNTEAAIVNVQRSSLVLQSGVSAQQIQRTQDKDASEVIRRVPGISIIDQKFVMVRGLSQRYNNVWINGSAVPSSEADSRAFSFDIIPSSQVDNMQIIKSPSPQYPADFSGGFILIDTKEVPNENSTRISVGASVNDQTHFSSFLYGKGSATDFLGFDNGMRSLQGGIKSALNSTAGGSGIDLLTNGLNNDWRVRSKSPVSDLSLSADLNRSKDFDNGAVFALLASLNYSNSYKTYSPMENALFGAYDLTNDQSVYLHKYVDQQYSHNVRLGGMLNLTFVPAKGSGRYEWKNIFNQLGTDRYTSRTGYDAQSNQIEEAEYYYSSRTTYNTQFTGKYVWLQSRLDWNAGYAYANRNLPDRRRYTLDNQLDRDQVGLTSGNEISREFTRLDEHIGSAAVNYRYDFEGHRIAPQLYTGAYAEYRHREYNTRSLIYTWNSASNSLPSGFRYLDLPTELMQAANYGDDGLYLIDETKMRNDYIGNHLIASAYAAVNLPIGAFNLYAGLRFEHSRMELISNTRDYEESHKSTYYDGDDIFPSVNATYKFNDQHQMRASYGRSVNRPEFREVSSSVFYDFDLASSVQGNSELKSCYIDNIDLRYEWYPAAGDQISIAGFYKHFDAPIEWTYTVTGGTSLVYSYENAASASSYGIEVDVRKNLGFIGLKDFTLVFNGSLIKSEVTFDDASKEKDRPMQGQSPYLVNLGIFYAHDNWNASLLYNRIGKRLIGVGRSLGSTSDQTVNIPDSYEMPRNSLDLSASRTFGHWDIKLGVKDILAEKVYFKQFNDVTLSDGTTKEVEEVTRSYRPGRNFNLTVTYKF